MPAIFPFKALRPAKGMELQVSASTHNTDTKAQLRELEQNPFTYLHVVKPHLHFNEEKIPEKHFPLAKNYINQLIDQKVLLHDHDPGFYIYRQTHGNDGKSFTGVVATVSAKDYYAGKIKVHENTRTDKELQLVEHIRITGVIGEPVLLTYHHTKTIDNLIADCMSKTADMIFPDQYGGKHELWQITDKAEIQSLSQAFSEVGDFYIADGHHRSAAAARYIEQDPRAERAYMAYLIPDQQLGVDSFHRIITNLDNFNADEFLSKLSASFIVTPSDNPVKPASKYEFGLCLKGAWYHLSLKEQPDGNALDRLAVSVLEQHVLNGILGITDSKTDHRLKFLPGKVGLDSLQKSCKSGDFLLAFTVFPCTIEEVFDIADEKLIMPPKSTYIEPKLRTGLIVQPVN